MKEVMTMVSNKELKQMLKEAKIEPDTENRNEFLEKIYEPDLSVSSFVKSQFFFIKGYVWLMSGFLFLLLLLIIGNAKCQEQI